MINKKRKIKSSQLIRAFVVAILSISYIFFKLRVGHRDGNFSGLCLSLNAQRPDVRMHTVELASADPPSESRERIIFVYIGRSCIRCDVRAIALPKKTADLRNYFAAASKYSRYALCTSSYIYIIYIIYTLKLLGWLYLCIEARRGGSLISQRRNKSISLYTVHRRTRA